MAVVLAVVVAAALGNACGNDEDSRSSTEGATTTTTSQPATTQTSALAAVQDVLASRIRGEFPGVQETKVVVDGDTLQLAFTVGEGETPGSARDYAQLAATELQTVAPDLVAALTDVTVTISQADGSVDEETYRLHGELLSIS